MCYYNPKMNIRQQPVPVKALEDAILAGHRELALRNLIFSGREPLLNAAPFLNLARFSAALPDPKLAVGLVTNGRGIAKHWVQLDALADEGALTFLDISLDSGVAAQHDAIRGVPGTFQRAYTSFKRCVRAWHKVRVSAVSVLRHDNASGILELVRRSSHFNRHFFIAIIQPPVFSTTRPLLWKEVHDFLHQLISLLEGELRQANLEVTLSLLGIYLWDAEREGYLRWEDIQEDAQGQCFVEHQIGDSRLQLHLHVLPETGRRIARITFTGAYLPNTHFLQTPRPEDFAVGYIQEEPLPLLYRRAQASESVLAKMLKSRNTHVCRARPCWSSCFGGLSAAEHSFMGGPLLNQQPALCLKSEAELV
jgi:hypothetical protein